MKINFVGNIFGTSGYANHTKGLFNALYELNSDIHLDAPLNPGWELQVNDAEMNAITKDHFDDGVMIMIGLPQQWRAGMVEQNKAFYGFCVWEGDRVPEYWTDPFIEADGILVPSTHTKEAIENTPVKRILDVSKNFFKDKIKIVPHGVDTNLFVPQEKPENQPFTFVANSGWAQGIHDRKGVQWLIKAFCEEFNQDEPVLLKLKINAAYCTPTWNLQEELDKLDLPKNRPELLISTANIEYKHVPTLYSGDCFVSPTMADAFNIPCLEALSCALPVITTDFGGQTDFVTRKNGWIIPTTPKEVTYDFLYEGTNWGMPDMAKLRKALRYAYENPEECRKKGEAGRKDVVKNLTWKKSAEKLLKILERHE